MKETQRKKEMEKITIREAESNEFGIVTSIYENEGSKKEAKAVRKVIEKEFQEIIAGRRIVLFAGVDGQPVGTVQLIFDSSHKDHADGKDIAHIHHLKVHKDFCRQGIGETLTQRVEEIARQRGFKTMTVGIDEDNPYSKRLFEKWGYKLFKIEPGRTKKLKLFMLAKVL